MTRRMSVSMTLDAVHLRPSSNPTGCSDPQPINVRTGSAAVAVFCAKCMWRTPVVGDYRTAQQAFDSLHGGKP